ncbi:MAG: Tol-Pal system protein TolB, partial [Pseudomonadota bacterium]
MKSPRCWEVPALSVMRGFRLFLFYGLALVMGVAQAQFRVDVSGVGLTQVPIAFAPFRGEDASPQRIASIVQADLERSG